MWWRLLLLLLLLRFLLLLLLLGLCYPVRGGWRQGLGEHGRREGHQAVCVCVVCVCVCVFECLWFVRVGTGLLLKHGVLAGWYRLGLC